MISRLSIAHLLHCVAFISFVLFVEILLGPGLLPLKGSFTFNHYRHISALEKYGTQIGTALIILRSLSLISIPAVVFHFIGLTFFECFPSSIRLKISPLLAPFVCIRIVTRGDFPTLVQDNVNHNLNICLNCGLRNFIIEVVTDKKVGVPCQPHVREILVPFAYETPSGAKYKARALQYCLEPEVNVLSANDWIVHLDEESILTESSVRGILNFIGDDDHDVGQGLITYASREIVNWWTTIADSFRVSADLGAVRAAHALFGKALFIFKGSFVVTRYSVETCVTFDNGPEGSIAEDTFFAMKASGLGFRFGWVQGQVHEISPFNFYDFFMQRKRWLQGLFHVVHSPVIPLKARACLILSFYTWVLLPLTLVNAFVSLTYSVTLGPFLDYLLSFGIGVSIYMYVFGAIRSFSRRRMGWLRCSLCVMGAVAAIPFNLVVEASAAVFGLFGDKFAFYVVKKERFSRKDGVVDV